VDWTKRWKERDDENGLEYSGLKLQASFLETLCIQMDAFTDSWPHLIGAREQNNNPIADAKLQQKETGAEMNCL